MKALKGQDLGVGEKKKKKRRREKEGGERITSMCYGSTLELLTCVSASTVFFLFFYFLCFLKERKKKENSSSHRLTDIRSSRMGQKGISMDLCLYLPSLHIYVYYTLRLSGSFTAVFFFFSSFIPQ